MPRVSILLPFHNAGRCLSHAIQSMLDQSLEDWELVLVNNASTDDSAVIAGAFAKKDGRIKLVEEQKKGIAFALNTGLAHCTANYIARMDADDISLPHRLHKQAEFLDANPQTELVSGIVKFCGLPGSEGYEAYVQQINEWKTAEDIYMHRFVESPLAHPSVMFRSAIIEKSGAYSTENIPEDYELWLRWLAHGVRMEKIDDTVLEWKDHAARLSRQHDNYSKEAFDKVRYHYLAEWLRSKQNTLPPVYVWGAGKLARRKVRMMEALGIEIEGYIDVKEQVNLSAPFIHYRSLPSPGEIFIISLVSNRGKFAEIRDYLLERGYKNEKDFLLAG